MLADIFVAFISTKIDTMANGIVTATTTALRALPKNSIRTMQTRPMPSIMVRPDLADGRRDKIAAIDIGDDVNVLRLELLSQLVDLGVDSGNDLRCVFVFEEIDDPLDGIRILVLAQDAFGLLVAVAQLPRSRTRIGRLLRWVTTILPRSSRARTSPTPRTTKL